MIRLIHKTIGECLTLRADLTPDKVGASCRGVSLTWKEIDEISDFLAIEYVEAGISKGSHGAIWSVNSLHWILCFFSLLKIGAIPVPVNTCYKQQELERLLQTMDIQYLFYGNGIRDFSYQKVLENLDTSKLDKLEKMIPLEPGRSEIKRNGFPKKLKEEQRKQLEIIKNTVLPEDTACILPTSGTTTIPKGVMLSHHSLVNNSLEITRQMHWNEEDRFCIAVPLFHCFGITTGLLAGIHTGGELQILKFYKTLDVFEQVERAKCTVLNGVPTMFLAMAKNEKRNIYDLTSLKSGIIAGSPIGEKEYQDVCQILGLQKLQPSYGQTESSPCISIADYQDELWKKTGNAGKIIPEIEVKIQQNQSGKGEGEILTRGYHVMQGYYNMEAETKAAVDDEGWLHTGDVGTLSQDGYLTVSGRIKDMIIRGGENISPQEIEGCLWNLEGVEDVKVIGVGAEVLQEEIAACIIWKPGMELAKEQVQAYVKKHLANYKIPRFVLSFSKFPYSGSGKVMTGELKRQVEKQISSNE